MRHRIYAFGFLIISTLASPALAQSSISEIEAQIDALWSAQDADWGWNHAEDTMHRAIPRPPEEAWAIDQWGQWMALEFSYIDDVYEQAREATLEWGYAVDRGEVSAADALAALRNPMQALVRSDALVSSGFATYLAQAQQRRFWLDRAYEIGPGNCRPYYFALAQAGRHLEAAQAALPSHLRHTALFPLPQEPERILDLQSLLPDPDADPAEQARAYDAVLLQMEALGIGPEDPLFATIAAMADQAEANTNGVSQLLTDARTLEPADREVVLRRAEAAALDRMGAVLPQMLASRAAQGPLSLEDIQLATDFVQRLRRFYDDAENPMARPTDALRALTGLRALVTLLQDVHEGPEAERLQTLAQDTMTALTPHTPAHSAHAIPGALVAAEVEIMAQAMEESASVLDAIAEYIRTGNQAALDRAIAGSQAVQELLNPANIARRLLQAEVEGLLANIPILRGVLDAYVDDLFAIALPQSHTGSYGAHCP